MPRSKDNNGYLHVTGSHLTKAGVFAYRGRQIPETDGRVLDPEKLYYGYRSAEELEKAVDSFNGIPLLIEHEIDSAAEPLKELRAGSVGTGCVWNSPYIDGELTITDEQVIELIESGRARELSAGYRYTPVWESGEADGKRYDFLITDIRANHVAIVPRGRSGRDVVVADAAEEVKGMEEILAAIKALNDKFDAFAKALEEHRKPEEEQPAIDEEGAKPEEEQPEEAKPEEEQPEGEQPDEEKIAQDAEDRAVARVKGMMKAAADVTPIYGRVDVFAFDSAEGIYGAALKANGVDLNGVDKSAYRAMVELVKRGASVKASKRSVAMDSADELAGVMAALENIKRG